MSMYNTDEVRQFERFGRMTVHFGRPLVDHGIRTLLVQDGLGKKVASCASSFISVTCV